MYRRIFLIIYLLSIFILPKHLHADTNTDDLTLYYRWVEKVEKDSAYYKKIKELESNDLDSLCIAYVRNGYRSVYEAWQFFMGVNSNISIGQVRQVVNRYLATHSSKELEMEEKVLEVLEMYREANTDTDTEPIYRKAEENMDLLRKKGYLHHEVRILIEMWALSYYIVPDYQRAFIYAERILNALDKAGPDFIPLRDGYFKSGILYKQFGNNEKALSCIKKAVTNDDKVFNFLDQADLDARTYLADYYFTINEMDSAEYYNRSILQQQSMVINRPFHNAVAICNLGHVALKKGAYEKAITLLDAGREVVYNAGDHSFVAQVDIAKGHCYLYLGDLTKATAMIASARSLSKSYNSNKLKYLLYELISRYYTYTGNPTMATLYQDSLLLALKDHNDQYAAIYQVRAEQQMRGIESAAWRETVRLQLDKYYLTLVILFSVVLLCIVFIYFYVKTKRTYRQLVRKNLEWALSETGEVKDVSTLRNKGKSAVEPGDQEIMERVFRFVIEEKNYCNPDLSLYTISSDLSVNRTYLSNAINRVTGKTFVEWLNEYRIKESIRLLSTLEKGSYSMEGIAYDTGFNHRSSFYRAFKKVTGLSPSAYVKNNKTTIEDDK